MEYEKYLDIKNDLENYFAKTIKKRFNDYVDEHFEFHFFALYEDHLKISKLIEKDGLEIYGMNVNSDVFQLLFNFSYEYLNIEGFPFSRLIVDFENDGNYSVYLSERSFKKDWTVQLEHKHMRLDKLNESDFARTIQDIKNTHLFKALKS